MSRPPVSVRFERDFFTLEFSTTAKALCLASDLVIPFSCIDEVRVRPADFPAFLRYFRVGTHLPGVLAAGRFYRKDDRRFYYVRRRTSTLDLRLRSHPYDRVIVTLEDPEATLAEIEKRAGIRTLRG